MTEKCTVRMCKCGFDVGTDAGAIAMVWVWLPLSRDNCQGIVEKVQVGVHAFKEPGIALRSC
jgi:hypothetical protein